MRFLFVHAWSGFSLAQWYLRDTLETSSPVPIEFRAYDMPVTGVPINDTLPRLLASWRPDIVGFSCHYWSTPAFLEASKWVGHLCPGATVVLGGPHVNSEAMADRLLRAHPTVHYVLRGAVSDALCQLVGAVAGMQGCEAIDGLSHRDGDQLRHNPSGAARSRRHGPIFHRGNHALTDTLSTVSTASYETMIGCRARCIYCVYPTEKFELIDDDLVRSELSYLCSLNVPNIRICDAHFAGVGDRAKMLLRHLANVNRRSSIKVYPDTRHVDAEYVRLLTECNADITAIGVQTTNPASLKAIKRRPVEDKLEAVRLLLDAFPNTPADVIVGLPEDDPTTLRQTLSDVAGLGFRRINAFRLHLFAGTTLGDLPSTYLHMPDVVQTGNGQVLSSKKFPPDSAAEVANLVHTARIVMPLQRTRAWLDRRHRAHELMGLCDTLPSAVLLDLAMLMEAFHPVALIRAFRSTVATLSDALGGDPQLSERLSLDLLEFLRSNCQERGLTEFQWDADAHSRRVRLVYVPLSTGAVACWDLRKRTLDVEPAQPERYGPDLLWIRGGAPARPEVMQT